jgi:UbiD family decarboxylase
VTGVRDVVLTKGGAGYLHAVVQIRKKTEGDGKNAIMAAFAAHTSLKHVVVVDEDIDICDPLDVEYAIATRVRGDTDVMIISWCAGVVARSHAARRRDEREGRGRCHDRYGEGGRI